MKVLFPKINYTEMQGKDLHKEIKALIETLESLDF